MTVVGPEMARILAMPRRAIPDPLPPRTARLASRLWAKQIETLAELEVAPPRRGVFCELLAGHGKTRPSLLAGYVKGVPSRRNLLIVPAALVTKTLRAIEAHRPLFPEAEGFWPEVLSSSMLSSKKRADELYLRHPSLIVVDEAHEFSDPNSARTKRLLRYVADNPNTVVMPLSGTMSSKDIRQVEHLAELTLREGSFLPLTPMIQQKWAYVLDYDAEPERERVEEMSPLVEWAGLTPAKFERAEGIKAAIKRVHDAHALRRRTTPGVVGADEEGVGCSLEMSTWRDAPSKAVEMALETLKTEWALPDGTELIEALDFSRHSATMSLGFYYALSYRGVDPSVDVEAWKVARREWSRALRRQLIWVKGYPNLDSFSRIVDACREGSAPMSVIRAWEAWDPIKDSVVVESTPVWHDRDVVRRAVKQFEEGGGRGLFWYASVAVGDLIREEGLMPVHGAGSDEPNPRVPYAACLIKSHGTGKDLQAWDRAFVFEPPTSGLVWEQLLARLHRPGQRSDSVNYTVNTSYWPLRARLFTARKKAEHLKKRSGSPQRLLTATWI